MKKLVRNLAAVLMMSFGIAGCATLKVTPLKEVKPVTKQPVKVGIQVRGDRLHDALQNPEGSAINAVSGKLFENVLLLPSDSLLKDPTDAGMSNGVDYVLTTTISDVSVSGNLNPYWFIAMPLLVFKPFTPIVTFESTVTLDHSIRDVKTGKDILRKQLSATATDHYSPINPQDKVRNLVGRAINNDFISVFEELHGKIPH
jgi:hypothetical protein